MFITKQAGGGEQNKGTPCMCCTVCTGFAQEYQAFLTHIIIIKGKRFLVLNVKTGLLSV